MSAAGSQQTGGSKVVSLNARASPGARTKTTDASNTSGPTDGDTSWRDSVETRLAELRTDMRHLLIAGGIVSLALLGAGWGVYTQAMEKMGSIAVDQQTIVGKIDTMDVKIAGKLELLGQRFDDNAERSAPARPD